VTVGYRFEWDPAKAAENFARHGVHFDEGTTVFDDGLSLTIRDPEHSWQEDRFVTTGHSVQRRLVVVVHTERDDRIRLISVRTATPRERRTYEKEDQS
jgi:uncharacterized DUF497 family protein